MEKHNVLIRDLANIKWVIRHHKSIGYLLAFCSIFCSIEALMGIISYIIADDAHAYLSFTEIFATNLTPSKSFIASFLFTNTFIWGFMASLFIIGTILDLIVTSAIYTTNHLKDNVNDAYKQKELKHEK